MVLWLAHLVATLEDPGSDFHLELDGHLILILFFRFVRLYK